MKNINSEIRDGYYRYKYDEIFQHKTFAYEKKEDAKLMQGIFKVINRSINENKNLSNDIVEKDYEASKLL